MSIDMPDEPHTSISFIVPVRNDAARLRRCLMSIRRQVGHPADRLEIIVADNGSTDGSDAVGLEAGAKVLRLPDLRVAALRNRAVEAARGDVIAFVDADHEIDEAWVASAIDTLRGPAVAAAGAPYDGPPDSTWVQRQYDRLRRRQAGVGETDWIGSGNIALWRHAFMDAGGFDTRLETCEDVDLCQRLRARGARVMSDARMRSTHFGDPATLRELFRGELWRGRDNLRVSLRPPLAVRNLVGVGVTMLELLLVACALVGAVTIAAGGWVYLLVGITGIAALTALQSIRMLRNRTIRAADLVQTPLVAGVYGIARALALVFRMPHQFRQGARPRV